MKKITATVKIDTHNLWSRLKQSDSSAFEQLYSFYINDLLNYGNKLTSETSLLKDCIHDVFIELWKYRNTVADAVNPKFYLFKSLRNKIFKSTNAIPIFITNKNIDDLFEAAGADMPDYMLLQSEEEVANTELLRVLLGKLTARQREAIHLHYYHNFSYEEMTHLMGMNYQSVLNLIQRALKTLRQETEKLPVSSILLLLVMLAATI
jgi:RNA polymerase sigma factor (sigma-70 family)